MAGTVLVTAPRAREGDDRPLGAVVRTLAAHGPVDVEHPEGSHDLGRIVDRLDGRRLIVAGGDATLHAVVAALFERGRLDTVVGLVPFGPANDFAIGVGLPFNPVEAATTAASAAGRPTDLLVDDVGEVVVNAVHLGGGDRLAAAIADRRAALGPTLAASGFTPFGASILIDGEPLDNQGPLLLVTVANGPAIGGSAGLAASATTDDGLVDIVVVPGEREVVHRRGREIRIVGDPISHDVDGEVRAGIRARSWRVHAGAWRLAR